MSTLIPGEQRRAVLIDGEPVKDVDNFMYLGSMFVANSQVTEEIRSSINLARSARSLFGRGSTVASGQYVWPTNRC